MLAKILVNEMSNAWFPMPVAYTVEDFATVAIPTAMFLAIAAGVGVRGILRIDLREALCTKAIG